MVYKFSNPAIGSLGKSPLRGDLEVLFIILVA